MKNLGQINGHNVIAKALLPDSEGCRKNLSVVLVDRGPHPTQIDRYVVSLYVEGDNGWLAGTYCVKYGEALAHFTRTAANSYREPT
jgi:hypothetical protein